VAVLQCKIGVGVALMTNEPEDSFISRPAVENERAISSLRRRRSDRIEGEFFGRKYVTITTIHECFLLD
jgi:hypothetical protein